MRDFDRGFLLGLYTALKLLEELGREEAALRIRQLAERVIERRVTRILEELEVE